MALPKPFNRRIYWPYRVSVAKFGLAAIEIQRHESTSTTEMAAIRERNTLPNTIETLDAKIVSLRKAKSPSLLIFALLSSIAILTGCGEGVRPEQKEPPVSRSSAVNVLAIGDSLLAWHRISRRSIIDKLEENLGAKVTDRSVVAARFNYVLPISGAMGLNISKQYRPSNWDWVVLNGGGNDLWFGCGCIACDTTIDKLIAPNADAGKIPRLVARIRGNGAQVIFVGYLHSPSVFSIIDHCKDENIEFERRLSLLAERDSGFRFLRLSNIVPDGDRSFHWIDMVHPSTKATSVIGERLAGIIKESIGNRELKVPRTELR